MAGLLFLALGTCGAPLPRGGLPVVAASSPQCGTIADFYASQPQTRLWVSNDRLTAKGRELTELLSGAAADGLDPDQYRALPSERALSAAFVRFVGDLTQAPASERIYYIDNELRRPPSCASTLLDQVAHAASLEPLLHGFREPNAIAAALRPQLAAERDSGRRQLLADDLALARSIGSPARFVLVDTAGQRLWMFDRGSAASMKVVVGKSGMDTTTMVGLIRFAVVNPYWDIPPDVVRNEVAPRFGAIGATAYLAAHDYEAVSSYDDSGVPVDAAAVDWSAVRTGSRNIGVRQLPGPENMMGRVMFMFPNKYGIYLHDTPARWVFSRSDRRLSHGCVRLERAADLYSWLFGRALADDESNGPATRENLPQPVPVYILPLRSGRLRG